ncbi:hypothetical protein CYMTET_16592 [Cymbomonas tetramitiformis]|uniref:Uncharacterized protein n=1 Tax=Cymbomonas tetramitiformis TaxID=36881 RepID=A0AAE0GBS9_9CHLO|nr:hypothetical protein CYMTET_16592 [Cymbomonas tetramitiformis]
MSQARQCGIAAALKAAHSSATPSTPTPATTPPRSPKELTAPRKIIRTTVLRAKPLFTADAPTAFEFFNDPFVLLSTPIEEGREEEFAEHLAYASSYMTDLSRFLRASGFKDSVGYTFDDDEAEADFSVLLAGLRHVLFSISYKEVAKLLDLYHDYDPFHVTINDILYTRLPHRLRYEVEGIPNPDTDRFWLKLRGTILDETSDPAPQLATIRVLGDKHKNINGYTDDKRTRDLWHVLVDSAKASPHTSPLYLVVLRELRSGASFSFASLCLRIRTAWRDESKHAVLAAPPTLADSPADSSTPSSGGARPKSPANPRMYALGGTRSTLPAKGEWVVDPPTYLYRKWEGTASPTRPLTCFCCHWCLRDVRPRGGSSIGDVRPHSGSPSAYRRGRGTEEILDHGPPNLEPTDDTSPPASPDGRVLNAAAFIGGSDDEQWPAFAPPKYWVPQIQGYGGATDTA